MPAHHNTNIVINSLCLVLREPPQLQYVEHQIPTIDIFHDKEQVVSCLKAWVEASQEWWLGLECQHFTLIECALHIVLLYNEVFLETLDGVHFFGGFALSQEHLRGYVGHT